MIYKLLAIFLFICLVTAEDTDVVKSKKYTLPPLPYPEDALEPFISARTMNFHYDKHHRSYVDNLNSLVDFLWTFPHLQKDLESGDLHRLMRENGRFLPISLRAEFLNHAGGFLNHNIFWSTMRAPRENNVPPETSMVYQNITSSWGSIEEFQDAFESSAKSLIGSGWTWLIAGCGEGDDRHTVAWLSILNYANQDHPHFGVPILPLDLFEHAYYLDYQNKRGEYVKAWWNVVNWDQVEANLQAACAKPKDAPLKDEL